MRGRLFFCKFLLTSLFILIARSFSTVFFPFKDGFVKKQKFRGDLKKISLPKLTAAIMERSEERRVGKECLL